MDKRFLRGNHANVGNAVVLDGLKSTVPLGVLSRVSLWNTLGFDEWDKE